MCVRVNRSPFREKCLFKESAMDETIYLPLNTDRRLANLRGNNEPRWCMSKGSFSKVILKCRVLCTYFPYFIFIISLIQVIFFMKCTQYTFNKLRFSQHHQDEVWRYLSYMLLHTDMIHIVLNIIIQCLVAIPLECEQGSLRVAVVYLIAGLAGSLGTEFMDPDLSVVGCSAGVYALLISHIPNNIVNSERVQYKSYRTVSVLTLCLGDISYYFMRPTHGALPTISWSSHVSGGLAGFLVGFVVYTNHVKNCTYFVKFTVFIFLLAAILGFVIYSGYLISCVYV